MKKIYTYFNEKGQDLIEFTLILAYCAVLLMGLNSDTFHNTIRAVFERGLFDDISTVITAGSKYTDALDSWSQSSRRTLVEVKYENGKYVLGKDVIPNAERLETDRQALYNIADFFLDMDYTTLKTKVFRNELRDEWFNQNTNNGKKGVLILSYTDLVDGVEDQYDPNTQQYNNDSTAKVEIKTEGRKFAANEVIHWMQGDYGNYKDPEGQYNSSLDFDENKRYLFSNEMIQTDKSKSNGDLKRNIRVNFTITDGKVTAVRVRAQQNGRDVPDLIIEKSISQ